MTADHRIRPAVPADAETLIKLRELMLREMGVDDEPKLASLCEKSMPWMQRALCDGQAAGWLAERSGEVLGGASMTLLHLQPQLNAQSGRIGQIYGLYVYPEYRGRRIASEIVRTAVAFAREQGCELATLHAAPKARPVYERLGFETSPEMRLFLRDAL